MANPRQPTNGQPIKRGPTKGKPTVIALQRAARELSNALATLRCEPPVAYVYRPLDYAWAMHAEYIARFADGSRPVLFLGMNPGPFGMAQTGIPFGEVRLVRDWLALNATIAAPQRFHPKRPVLGLSCPRSEVSGARLWGAIAARHREPATFFARHFVVNYCPLLFLDEAGRNITPDKLPRGERTVIEAACDVHLATALKVLRTEVVVGVGGFAERRARAVVDKLGLNLQMVSIPHPSPASPKANLGWLGLARRALADAGLDGAL
jgi:single-strand selective monofunctional uracil DNA glycosylase